MNLATKIYKFKRAVWDYRGKYDPRTGVYKLPKAKAKALVLKGLARLSIEAHYGMEKIDSLHDKQEFEAWIENITRWKK